MAWGAWQPAGLVVVGTVVTPRPGPPVAAAEPVGWCSLAIGTDGGPWAANSTDAAGRRPGNRARTPHVTLYQAGPRRRKIHPASRRRGASGKSAEAVAQRPRRHSSGTAAWARDRRIMSLLVVLSRPASRLHPLIDKTLSRRLLGAFRCPGREKGLHADAESLIVTVDAGPLCRRTAAAGSADAGEDRRYHVVAEGEQRGDRADGIRGYLVAEGPARLDDEVLAAELGTDL